MSDDYYRRVIAHRMLADGRELLVAPLTFGRARLNVSPYAQSRFYLDAY